MRIFIGGDVTDAPSEALRRPAEGDVAVGIESDMPVTARVAAEMTGFAHFTISELCRRGQLMPMDGVKNGRASWFERRDVEIMAYLANIGLPAREAAQLAQPGRVTVDDRGGIHIEPL